MKPKRKCIKNLMIIGTVILSFTKKDRIMTIISASLSKDWISVSSDSLRTTRADNRTVVVVEDQLQKIVEVKTSLFHGALAWCGYSGHQEDLFGWIRDQCADIPDETTAEIFAKNLTKQLNTRFEQLKKDFGVTLKDLPWIAIHMTVFEKVEGLDILVPELFYIHNVRGDYTHSGEDVICQRHARFHSEPKTSDALHLHGDIEHRRAVAKFLEPDIFGRAKTILVNNPKPDIFSSLQNVVLVALQDKRILPQEFYKQATTVPIVLAANVLRHGALPETYWIGGAIHNLLISRAGSFIWSDPIQPN